MASLCFEHGSILHPNKLAEYEERFGGVNEDLRERASFECDPQALTENPPSAHGPARDLFPGPVGEQIRQRSVVTW